MARIEFPEEVRRRAEGIGSTDLIIGIAGSAPVDEIQAKATAAITEMSAGAGPLKIVIACAGSFNPGEETGELPPPAGGPTMLAYPLPAHDPSAGPWIEMSNMQRSVLSLASLLQPKACAVLYSDLHALQADTLSLLTSPVIDGRCNLVMPIYPEGKYDGLINKSLLAPVSRAIFSRRVRQPLPFDFCVSSHLLAKLGDGGGSYVQPGQLLWPSNIVSMESGQIWQAHLGTTHSLHTDGLELSAVLGQLSGALFQEIESYAAQWQRSRPSLPSEICGTPTTVHGGDVPVDARPLIDSFILGSRNLDEVWRLVLPPASLFEVKRLTTLPPEQFRMPDQLWARIIYDFVLAYRLRRISRAHLLGALTPLYLGWVASYAQEVATATTAEADQRIEKLARAFEESKPYFVSRWRWPDRTG